MTVMTPEQMEQAARDLLLRAQSERLATAASDRTVPKSKAAPKVGRSGGAASSMTAQHVPVLETQPPNYMTDASKRGPPSTPPRYRQEDMEDYHNYYIGETTTPSVPEFFHQGQQAQYREYYVELEILPPGVQSFEQWSRTLLESGKHRGKTYQQTITADPSYGNWIRGRTLTDPSLLDFQKWLNARRNMDATGSQGPVIPGSTIVRRFGTN